MGEPILTADEREALKAICALYSAPQGGSVIIAGRRHVGKRRTLRALLGRRERT